MFKNNLSEENEALLILEYLESEHMSKTFLNFLDENKHLAQLRARLYANYENSQQINPTENDSEVNEFQAFFNLSKQIVPQLNQNQQNDQIINLLNKTSNDLYFDDDFLNDIISQTPPMDYQHELPDTPIPSTTNNENENFNSIEQLFPTQHLTPSHQIIHAIPNTPSRSALAVPYTKCVIVTQDFLQSMYNQPTTIINSNINYIHEPKRRRRRRLKIGKENYYQQRKIMPKSIT